MERVDYQELEKSKEDLIKEINQLKSELIVKNKIIDDYERESRKNTFIQIFNHHQKFIRAFNLKYPSTFNIFLFMCENCDKNNEIYVQQKQLAKIFNISERKVREKIKILSDHKLITKRKNGRCASYIINSKLCWKSSVQQRLKFSRFHEQPVYLNIKTKEGAYTLSIQKGVR